MNKEDNYVSFAFYKGIDELVIEEVKIDENMISVIVVVKSGPDSVHGMYMNFLGRSGTLTLYDNVAASGVKIAKFKIKNTLEEVLLDFKFMKGLTMQINLDKNL